MDSTSLVLPPLYDIPFASYSPFVLFSFPNSPLDYTYYILIKREMCPLRRFSYEFNGTVLMMISLFSSHLRALRMDAANINVYTSIDVYSLALREIATAVRSNVHCFSQK